jgi:hypothetical protein
VDVKALDIFEVVGTKAEMNRNLGHLTKQARSAISFLPFTFHAHCGAGFPESIFIASIYKKGVFDLWFSPSFSPLNIPRYCFWKIALTF